MDRSTWIFLDEILHILGIKWNKNVIPKHFTRYETSNFEIKFCNRFNNKFNLISVNVSILKKFCETIPQKKIIYL